MLMVLLKLEGTVALLLALSPQATTLPSAVRAKLYDPAAEMFVKIVPDSIGGSTTPPQPTARPAAWLRELKPRRLKRFASNITGNNVTSVVLRVPR
jgi:hypothetical protein